MTSKEQDMVRKRDGERNPGNEVALAEKNTTRRMTNPEFAEEQADEDGN